MLVPDYVQPTSGWRVWFVVREHGRLRLASVMYPTLWMPRREEIAVCRPVEGRAGDLAVAPSREPHGSPDLHCGCGIYASKTVGRAASYFDGDGPSGLHPMFRVIGRVSLWGRVVESEGGYRASHAYPSHLYVPAFCLGGTGHAGLAEIVDGLSAYGVPVELLCGTARGVAATLAA